MADKEKRLRKILSKSCLKGQLKLVKTLEEAIIIIVENSHYKGKNTFFNKQGYQMVLSRGDTFADDLVYFTVPTNPRNIREITRSILIKSPGTVERPL